MIGVVGAGLMGGAIVQRLRALGHAVAVRDIDPAAQARAAAAGAAACDTPAALARRCATVIVAVVDGAQVHQVLFGADDADHDGISRRARATDIRMPRPSPSVTIAVPP